MRRLFGWVNFRNFFVLFLFLVIPSLYVVVYHPSIINNYLVHQEFEVRGFHRSTVKVDGFQVRCYEKRSSVASRPTILLVHGFRSSCQYWLPYLEGLGKYFDIILMDLPGHGETNHDPVFYYDLRSYGAFVDKFAKAKGLNDLYVLGSSMGGGVTFSFAAQTDLRLRAVATLNPLAVIPPKLSMVHEALYEGKNLLLPSDRNGVDEMMYVVYGPEIKLDWTKREFVYYIMRERRKHFLSLFQQMEEGGGIEDLLRRIKCPVLIIQGDDDLVVDPSGVAIENELINDCTVHWIKEGAHSLTGLKLTYALDRVLTFFDQKSAPNKAEIQ